jgi:HlyD family secretion protein
MRTFVTTVVILAVVVSLGFIAYPSAAYYWELRSLPKWRTAEVIEGNVIAVVNSTGTIKPVLQISVGAFVSGPIDPEYQLKDSDGNPLFDKEGRPLNIAEFNQEVKKGDVLAKIDPRIYVANVARDRATLATRMADVERAQALYQQAINDEFRAMALRDEDPAFIAQAEIDKVRFSRLSLEAQVKVAQASVDQAQAQLDLSIANENYTQIVAPVDGMVINRKIDPGQTLAAQFQTPELFVIAPEMRKKMHVHASVDEADIGLIRAAQSKTLPVTFTVDSYPDELFTGTIEEIRLSWTTTQNVVTYPVVVAAPNPDLKLLPGMTPSISFEVERRIGVLKIPNSALRFFPQPRFVRDQDKPLVEGRGTSEEEEEQPQDLNLSAEERAEARRKRNKRHVWVQDGLKLRAVEVQTGLSDSQHTELVKGDLKKGDLLVTGIQPPTGGWGQ